MWLYVCIIVMLNRKVKLGNAITTTIRFSLMMRFSRRISIALQANFILKMMMMGQYRNNQH